MNTAQIMALEKKNEDKIIFVKGAMYYKAYEKSCYLLSKDIDNLLLIKRFVKCVDSDIVYVRFDFSSLGVVLMDYEKIEETANTLTLRAKRSFNAKDFERWRESIPLLKSKEKKKDQVIELIQKFDISRASPMSAFDFVRKLQSMVVKRPSNTIE